MKTNRNESGIAMITAILVITIVGGLTTIVLTNSTHADRSSQRGRNWTVALQTADSGVQRTLAYMQATNGAVPGPVTGATADGSYTTTVTSLGRHRYQIDSTGSVGAGAGLATVRSVRVVIGPPKSFRYALFSMTDVDTKNNNLVEGDVWANGNVTVQQNDTVQGSANAATGWVFLDNGSRVTGSVVSGGYNTANGRAIDVEHQRLDRRHREGRVDGARLRGRPHPSELQRQRHRFDQRQRHGVGQQDRRRIHRFLHAVDLPRRRRRPRRSRPSRTTRRTTAPRRSSSPTPRCSTRGSPPDT